ncbi:hypothetical protein SCLCIDRAFT_98005, partial [Scleroderma citrinum Foug A]
IPTLKSDGSNWLTYKKQVEWAMEAKGLVEYLDGTILKPLDPSTGKDSSWKPMDEEKLAVTEYPDKLAVWKKDNGCAKQILGSLLPEIILIKIPNDATAHEIWDALSDEFQNHSHVVAIELHRKLQDLRCADKGNLQAHFDKMARSSYHSALLAGESLGTGQCMILFDSGASHHMSSYREQFTNFKSIAPKPITAADKHTFEAIRKGDLTI